VHSLVDFGLQVTGIGVVFAALIVILVADHNVESLDARKGERRPHRRRTGGSSELAKAPRSDLL
jgi:hypothetical protein